MILAIAGSVAILLFLGLFGIKILEGFSFLADSLHPSLPQTKDSQAIIQPPVMDPLPEATNSATIKIAGTGLADLTLIFYVDDSEARKVKVDKDGSFSFDYETIGDGKHTFSAKLSDDKGNVSDVSNVVETTVKLGKPNLDVTSPADNATVFGDTNTVLVSGTTDEGNSVTINGRFVPVKSDGSFSYSITLHDGDNTLTIITRDQAGNETKLDRHATYHK